MYGVYCICYVIWLPLVVLVSVCGAPLPKKDQGTRHKIVKVPQNIYSVEHFSKINILLLRRKVH